jgi:hypothetical protein
MDSDTFAYIQEAFGGDAMQHVYVECALVAENQEGALSACGTAVAQLPSRTA